MNPLTIKSGPPVRAIVVAVAGALVLLCGIGFAIWYIGEQSIDARLPGTVTAKVFNPQPERQISIGEDGLQTQDITGQYVLTVSVPQRSGEPRIFQVWVNQERFESINVGDPFEVGAYLVR